MSSGKTWVMPGNFEIEIGRAQEAMFTNLLTGMFSGGRCCRRPE